MGHCAAGYQVDSVHAIFLKDPGKGYRIGGRHAAFDPVVRHEPEDDRIVGANVLSRRPHQLNPESRSASDIAAILVRPLVDKGGQELRNKIAGGPVYHNAVKPGFFRNPRSIAVFGLHAAYVITGNGPPPTAGYGVWDIGRGQRELVLPAHVCVDLDNDFCPSFMYRLNEPLETW